MVGLMRLQCSVFAALGCHDVDDWSFGTEDLLDFLLPPHITE